MNKPQLFVVFAMLTATPAWAQDWYAAFSYSVSVPTAATSDFVPDASWRGLALEGRYRVAPRVTAGFSMAWNAFDTRTRGLFSLENLEVFGTQFRYVNTFPVFVNGHYYLGSYGNPRLFVGGNVGAVYGERRLDVGVYSITRNQWHFGVAPEVGVVVPLDYRLFGVLAARWTYAFEASDEPELAWWSFNFGLAWN